MDLFLTNTQRLASQDIINGLEWITCGLLWCFYQLFGLSFWWHPFTADDPSVSKLFNATFLQICSDKLIYTSDDLRYIFSTFIYFCIYLCIFLDKLFFKSYLFIYLFFNYYLFLFYFLLKK